MIKRRIFLIGAFDRYNYGDLLFPIITQKALMELGLNSLEFNYVGLLKTNGMIKYGGLKTIGIEKLFKKNFIRETDIIFFVGGETLGATYDMLYQYIKGKFPAQKKLFRYIRYFEKITSTSFLSFLFNRFMNSFRIHHDYPFLVSKADFRQIPTIIYNSTGGTSIDYEKDIYFKKLQKVDYLSVRDNVTKRNLIRAGLNACDIKLYPDVVHLINHFFPVELLREYILRAHESRINELVKKKYLCFQCSLHAGEKHVNLIVKELKKIKNTHKLKIVLLPISTAYKHDDNILLEKVYDKSKQEFILLKELNIYETAFIIANAACFIGSSLHGAITSIAYNVPHIAVPVSHTKVESYLKNWDIEGQNLVTDFSNLVLKVQKVLSLEDKLRKQNSQELEKKAYQSIHNIVAKIKNYK